MLPCCLVVSWPRGLSSAHAFGQLHRCPSAAECPFQTACLPITCACALRHECPPFTPTTTSPLAPPVAASTPAVLDATSMPPSVCSTSQSLGEPSSPASPAWTSTPAVPFLSNPSSRRRSSASLSSFTSFCNRGWHAHAPSRKSPVPQESLESPSSDRFASRDHCMCTPLSSSLLSQKQHTQQVTQTHGPWGSPAYFTKKGTRRRAERR